MMLLDDVSPQDESETSSQEHSQKREESQVQNQSQSQERILDQDEIDNLLGIEGQEGAALGLEAILNSGKVSYERLPMLEVVFDRLIRHLSTSLRNFTNDTVELKLNDISSTRFGDYQAQVEEPALLGVFSVKEWEECPGLIQADRDLIYTVVDVLLGSKRGAPSKSAVPPRPYTSIEQKLVASLLELILEDFSTSFEPISAVNFQLERLETNPSFATIVRPVNVAIVVRIQVKMENGGGNIEFLIPYASLEPVRDTLLQMFMGEKFGQDPVWEQHFAGQLWETRIPVSGVLKTLSASLNEVLRWKKGSRLMLDIKGDAPIDLRCGDLLIGTGRMGQKNNRIAVQVEQSFIKEKK